MQRPSLRPFVIPVLALAVAAAGCADDSSGVQTELYTVQLQALNTQVAGNVSASGEITVTGDQLTARIDASGMDDTLHPQHIHLVASCPTMADDANGDGYLDVIEGAPSYGLILVPLDDDLSSQAAGSSGFPTGSSFSWEETTSMSVLMADLQAADPDSGDPVVKLDAGESLDLAGRSVVIHGVADEDLPETVQGLGGLPGNVVLPIACGTIIKSD